MVVTHDIPTAFKIADTMVMMQGGQVLLAGDPSMFESSDDEAVRRFLDGEASPEELGALVNSTAPLGEESDS